MIYYVHINHANPTFCKFLLKPDSTFKMKNSDRSLLIGTISIVVCNPHDKTLKSILPIFQFLPFRFEKFAARRQKTRSIHNLSDSANKRVFQNIHKR